jgi:hypothetical protein
VVGSVQFSRLAFVEKVYFEKLLWGSFWMPRSRLDPGAETVRRLVTSL